MLKSSLLGACAALSLAACATTSAPPATAAANDLQKPPPGCVAQTATRIPVKDDTCAGFGQTYTQKDIQNTGQQYADKALSMLDPAVQISGNGH
jgi:hypothetical protein